MGNKENWTGTSISDANIVTASGFVGPVTGAVTGDVVGDVTGDLTGDITSTVFNSSGPGLVGTSTFGAPDRQWYEADGVIVTTFSIDLTGLASAGTTEDVIGLAAGGAANLGPQLDAVTGVIFKAELACIETPTGTTVATDIDIATNSSASLAYDGAASTGKLINGASLTVGQTVENLVPAVTAGDSFYIVEGTGTAGGTYTAGQFILRIYGRAPLA